MEQNEERSRSARESFLSADAEWWSATFWLFMAQLALEAVMVVLDEWSRLSAMTLVEQARFIRSEITDDILISIVIAIALVDLWRYALITAGWLQRRIERREERIRNEGIAEGHDEGRKEGRAEGREEGIVEGRKEGRNEGIAEGQDQVLRLLDENARKDIERKLRRNGNSDTRY